jgi:hypothetical protein
VLKGLADRSDLLAKAMLPAAEQQRLFEASAERHPVSAALLLALAQRSGKTIEFTAEDVEREPFTYALFAPLVDDLRAAVLWGLMAGILLPRPLSLTAVYLWLVPIGLGLIKAIRAIAVRRRSLGRDGQPHEGTRQGARRGPALAVIALAVLGAAVGVWHVARSTGRGDLGPAREPVQSVDLTNWPVTLRGIGPVQVGMTVHELEQVLRGKLLPLGHSSEDGTCTMVQPPAGLPGIAFMMSTGSLARVDIAMPGIRSLSGAQVGDPEGRLLELYPGRLTVQPHLYEEGGHYLTFEPRDSADRGFRMVFETDGKVVTRFRAGRVPEVHWVELCL